MNKSLLRCALVELAHNKLQTQDLETLLCGRCVGYAYALKTVPHEPSRPTEVTQIYSKHAAPLLIVSLGRSLLPYFKQTA